MAGRARFTTDVDALLGTWTGAERAFVEQALRDERLRSRPRVPRPGAWRRRARA